MIKPANHWRREEENNHRGTKCKMTGLVEGESAQQMMVKDVPGVVECKSAQQAAAREVLGVIDCESAQ
jgi:hypothetical protein